MVGPKWEHARARTPLGQRGLVDVAVDEAQAVGEDSSVHRPGVRRVDHVRGRIAARPFGPAGGERRLAGSGIALDRIPDGDRAVAMAP